MSIWFYTGNESRVELYMDNMGFMWENAADFDALLVFAEHRYYGDSQPLPADAPDRLRYLTTEQALADYAHLLVALRGELGDPAAPVVAFGGSYGGMLAAWARMKYPHIFEGAIAASAPVWMFQGELPHTDPLGFARVVTQDAAAAHPACPANVRAAWGEITAAGATSAGRRQLREDLQLCEDAPLETQEHVRAAAAWLQDAFDWLAMGNYPYPSSYMTMGGAGQLPAWPMHAACAHLSESDMAGRALIRALGAAAGVFYNATGTATCYEYDAGVNKEADRDTQGWSFQSCTEMVMPFARNGADDMFWPQPYDAGAVAEACRAEWGVTPRPLWATTQWGGRRLAPATNIVFSNGLLDPWSAGQVLRNISDSLVAVVIPEGAHHIDLMFSNEADPPSVLAARDVHRAHIRRWTAAAQKRRGGAREPVLLRV